MTAITTIGTIATIIIVTITTTHHPLLFILNGACEPNPLLKALRVSKLILTTTD